MYPCFENYIGIRALCDSAPPPVSGLYWDDLEGLRLTQTSQMADGQFATGKAFLEAKFSFALKQFTEEIIGELPRHANYRWNGLLTSVISGEWGNTFASVPNPAVGLRINKSTAYRLAKISIRKVILYSDTTATDVPITIRDGNQDITFTADLTANVPVEVPIDYQATPSTVFILWDGAGNVNQSVHPAPCGCAPVPPITVEGWDGTAPQKLSYGIRAEVALTCDEGLLMCALAHRMGNLLLYRTAVEVAKERLASDRLNYFSFNKEEAQRLLTLWEQSYLEKRRYFFNQLPSFLNHYDDACLSCTAPVWSSVRP